MIQIFGYIGEPRIDEARDKFLLVKDPDIRGYYVQQLDVYKKSLSETEFWQDSKRDFYNYFATHWRMMIINYDIDQKLMRSHKCFDWINLRIANPVDKKWNKWRDRHRVVDKIINEMY